MSRRANRLIFKCRNISGVRFLSNSLLAFVFTKIPRDESPCFTFKSVRGSLSLVSFPDPEPIGLDLHLLDRVVLNSENNFVQWYLRVRAASQEGRLGLNEDKFTRLSELLMRVCKYPHLSDPIPDLAVYLAAWRTIPGLPPELCTPETSLSPERFDLHPRRPRNYRSSVFRHRKD